MSTMHEMAEEYRFASAKLARHIQARKAADASKSELTSLQKALNDIRLVQRVLDSYYTDPRAEEITSAGWKGDR